MSVVVESTKPFSPELIEAEDRVLFRRAQIEKAEAAEEFELAEHFYSQLAEETKIYEELLEQHYSV